LRRTLHEQTAAVMLKDTARLNLLAPAIAKQVAELRRIDDLATQAVRDLVTELDVKATLRAISDALGKDEGRQFVALSNRVKAAAQAVHELATRNKELIEAELPADWAKPEIGLAAVHMQG
jgi:hypothetical protein